MPTPPSPPPSPPTPPTPPAPLHTQPHALTFFLTTAQRRAVLSHLKRLHPHRTTALLAALRLQHLPAQSTRTREQPRTQTRTTA